MIRKFNHRFYLLKLRKVVLWRESTLVLFKGLRKVEKDNRTHKSMIFSVNYHSRKSNVDNEKTEE